MYKHYLLGTREEVEEISGEKWVGEYVMLSTGEVWKVLLNEDLWWYISY